MVYEMPSSDAARQEFLRNAGVLRVNSGGREFDFRYPNSVNMRNVVTAIFQGTEYPIIPLPEYAPAIIVDVGANVGASVLYFHHVYPNARIYCYEPSWENYVCLQENACPLGGKVLVFPYGLLDKDGEVPLYRGTSQTGQNSIVPNSETTAAPTESVRLVKVSREAAERGWKAVSILKLDTEGCEVPILTEFLAAVPALDILYCEYHAEEDRRRIDALVSDRFLLYASNATKPHLGTCVYVARSLIHKYPHIDCGRKSVLATGAEGN
jgi:FkbM family methyltransferase